MRRVWVACALVLAAFAGILRADSKSPPRFDDLIAHDRRAEEAYRTGDLDGAAAEWTAYLASPLSARSEERARVLYNLGNVAFRQNKVLEAVGWYTAALRLRPRDDDTWRNLEHARSTAKLDPADRGDLTATLHRVLTSLTPAESERVLLGAIAACAACLALEALRGGRLWRRVSLLSVLVVVVAALPYATNRMRERGDPQLVVATGRTALHSEPRAEAAGVGEVAPGDEVEKLDALPDWVKIRTESGAVGWVPAPSVFALRR